MNYFLEWCYCDAEGGGMKGHELPLWVLLCCKWSIIKTKIIKVDKKKRFGAFRISFLCVRFFGGRGWRGENLRVVFLAATSGSEVCITFSGVCLSVDRRVLLCLCFIRGLQRWQLLSWSVRKPQLSLARPPSSESLLDSQVSLMVSLS